MVIACLQDHGEVLGSYDLLCNLKTVGALLALKHCSSGGFTDELVEGF
jgi:hypothetical protein